MYMIQHEGMRLDTGSAFGHKNSASVGDFHNVFIDEVKVSKPPL